MPKLATLNGMLNGYNPVPVVRSTRTAWCAQSLGIALIGNRTRCGNSHGLAERASRAVQQITNTQSGKAVGLRAKDLFKKHMTLILRIIIPWAISLYAFIGIGCTCKFSGRSRVNHVVWIMAQRQVLYELSESEKSLQNEVLLVSN